MGLDEFTNQFELALQEFVSDVSARSVANLHDAMAYALGTDIANPLLRGKRIRPGLCLLASQAMGASPERAMPFALAIELMHNFCLVHDDIEDEDRMRRGRESVWAKYGLPHAVNIGDYLLVQAHRPLTGWGASDLDGALRLRLLGLLVETLDHTHIGQAMDMNARRDRSLTIDDYMRIVREKTGYYLAAPIQGGVIAAGGDEALVARIRQMAEHLGPMFQIMDDLIDLTEGKGRESAGSDVREGKRSFMAVWTAANCSGAERERLYEILDTPRADTRDEEVSWVIDLFKRRGAIDAGRDQCAQLHAQSRSVLQRLPKALEDALTPVFEGLANRAR